MTSLKKLRTRFTLILAILLAIDVGLVAYLLWPGRSDARAEERQLQQEYLVKSRQVAPLIGMDKKLERTRDDIKAFNSDRVLGRWSQISNELHKLAQQSGVSLESISYKPEDSGIPNLQVVTIGTGIGGDYVKIVHFINALERDKVLFVINQIELQAQQGGMVELKISFETFLKEAA